jgi:hypothetical protein
MNVTFLGNYVSNYSLNLENLDIFAVIGLNCQNITFNHSTLFNISNVTSVIMDNFTLS